MTSELPPSHGCPPTTFAAFAESFPGGILADAAKPARLSGLVSWVEWKDSASPDLQHATTSLKMQIWTEKSKSKAVQMNKTPWEVEMPLQGHELLFLI